MPADREAVKLPVSFTFQEGAPTPAMSESFYAEILPVDDFQALASPESYVPLPDDWWIVAADVIDSTTAIAGGDYKAVNSVGVSVIAAVTNSVRPMEVPYVFGGDGACVCLPARVAPTAIKSVAATVAMAREVFELELRGAVVPVSYVRAKGHDVRVAKHRVSQHYDQCAFFGGGVEHVERELKSDALPHEYLVEGDPSESADYSGLECRWAEVPSPSEETVAVIIDATSPGDHALDLYRGIMTRISEIYGDAEVCRPVTEDGLRATLSRVMLRSESRLRTWGRGLLARLVYPVMQRIEVVVGWVLIRLGVDFRGVAWGSYKRDLVANSDFRKFDGCLRLVLAGKEAQRTELEGYLKGLRRTGDVVFGMHVSESALITCLIERRQGAHFHFVDAAGGGYALAAKALKEGAAP